MQGSLRIAAQVERPALGDVPHKCLCRNNEDFPLESGSILAFADSLMLRALWRWLCEIGLWASLAFGFLLWAGSTLICSATREMVYVIHMKSDLRFLAEGSPYFRERSGARITTDSSASSGWRATATDERASGVICFISRDLEPVCHDTGGRETSWVARHLTVKRIFHIYVELWLLTVTVWLRRRRSIAMA